MRQRVRTLLTGVADEHSNRGRAARLMSATAFGQLLSLATAPLLTRWLGPSAFGVFGVYLAVLGSLSGAVSWRLGLAVPIPHEERDARAVLATGVLASFVSALVVLIAVALFGEIVTHRWFAEPAVEPFLWFLPPALLGVALGDVLGGWGLRHRVYDTLVRQRVARSVWTAVWQLVHGFLIRGSAGALVVGDTVGRLGSVVPMARMAWKAEREKGPLPTFADVRAALTRFRTYVLAATPANFANKLGEWLPVLLLTAWWDASAAGLFVVGQRLVGVPIGLLGDSAGQVYMAELAAGLRGDRSTLPALFARYARALGQLALLTAAILLAIGPWGFGLALGQEWADAGRMVRWQAIAMAISLVAISMAHTLVILEFPRRQLAWDLLRLATTLGAFVVARQQAMDAVGAVAIYGVVSAITYAALIAMGWQAVRQRAHSPAPAMSPPPPSA